MTGPEGDAGADQGPPVAPRRPTVLEAHGDRRVDEWFWLRQRDDPDVLSLLRAENAYTERQTAHLAGLRDELFTEMKARIVETDLSVPVAKGPWWYYERTLEGRDYVIHCRLPVRSTGLDATPPSVSDGERPDEQVLLDENVLAEGHEYLDVANLAVSPGHSRLAYAFDTTGDEHFTLKVRDLESGDDLEDAIEGTSYGVAWANDDNTVFFTRPDAANRPFQLWRHRVGSPPEEDVLVVEESDERFHLGVGRTKDGAYVVVEMHSRITSEVQVIPADRPEEAPRVVLRRAQGVEYGIEHHDGTFIVLTNDRAENFRVVATPADSPSPLTWTELIPHRPDVRLEGLDVFSGHLVSYERRQGMPRIRVIALPADGPRWARELPEGYLVPCPETPSASWGGPNPEFTSRSLRYEYSSLVTPRSVYDLDLDTGSAVLRKRQPVLGGYDPARYATERLWATAPDGTEVPLSIISRRDVARDGTAPCLLYGYGSYEYSIDPIFSSLRLSLLDRGFVFAIAHVRGGGELGRHWYEDGKLLAKPNTFSDFVACARKLIEDRWTAPDRLVARGGSAGGLLVGAVANLAPELFRAMVAEVPFVDCLSTMLDDTLPLTVIEWEEWGNPGADPEVYAVMKSYTPYEGVRPTRYPALLVTAGLEDPRVGYWEPAKWVQKLRDNDPDGHVLLKVELDSGHAGPSGRYEAWRDEAFVVSFVLDAVGRGT
ncbi:MAG: S9 family peptidase [Acidimicrobiales bacterium]